MAEYKRQNPGGKAPVAMPNMGPASMIPLEHALAGAIGARIRLQTTLPAQPMMEGTLFTACPVTNLVAIAVSTSPNTPPIHHVLPISSIQNFTLISAPATPNGFATPPNTTPALSNVPTAALMARADAAVARLKEAASRKNKAVGKEAQDLFDGISRTLPIRWDGNNMIVMDSVIISAPYRGEDCKAGHGVQSQTLSRVRKVVDNERRKFADRERKVVVPAVPAIPAVHTGPRKGG
ncbi:MAG: hypothetical protein L6R37_003512 [Teloschistes peruensis]|nr:MAG: hypothetical protein L6R37_003512 [Teloschistes peruensis]